MDEFGLIPENVAGQPVLGGDAVPKAAVRRGDEVDGRFFLQRGQDVSAHRVVPQLRLGD